jgi:hypothetical protein
VTSGTTPDLTQAAPIRQLATAYWRSRCLHVAVELGLADAIGDGVRSAEALAEETGTDPGALARLLRALASFDVFVEADGGYGQSPASQFLRTDHPQSMVGLVRFAGAGYHWATWGGLEHSVRTGEPAFDHLFGCNSFDYFKTHPTEGRVFDQAMSGKAQADVGAVVGAYDFSRFARIADIGGGKGHLIRGVLGAAPEAQGLLFDLPEVAGAAGKAERLTIQGGDFFKDTMPVCDAYVLMMILHDWDDDACVRILSNLRRAAPDHARLLIVEAFLPEEPGPAQAKITDIEMLVLTGGRERTATEFNSLLARAGFRFLRTIHTATAMAIFEAEPAPA